MKQTITIEQFHDFIELNNELKMFNSLKLNVLFSLLQIEKHIVINENHFSIESMLFILQKKVEYINFMFYPQKWSGWCLNVTFNNGEKFQSEYVELCDGLWECLKKVCEYEL